MRTKNKKWIGPVPIAAVAALALAAFISAGLLLAPGSAQPAEAQSAEKCVSVDQDGNAAPGNSCQVTATQATITLTNNGTNEKNFYVFGEKLGTGPLSVFPNGTTYDAGTKKYSAKPLRYQVVKVPARTLNDGSATVTISGSHLSKQTIYVYTTTGFPQTADISDDPDDAPISIALPSGGTAITVDFLGPPVKDVKDEGAVPTTLPVGACTADNYDTNDVDADKKPDPRSTISVTGADNNVIPGNANALTVTVKVWDAHCRPLKGSIAYTVTYADGSALNVGRQSYTSPSETYVDAAGTDNDKGTTHPVSGWKASGAVSVDVSATFTGETGTLTLVHDTLARSGDATMLDAGIYNYACVDIGAAADTNAANDKIDMKRKGCAMVDRFGEGDKFAVVAKATDSLGTQKYTETIDEDGPSTDVVTSATHGASNDAGPGDTDVPFTLYTVAEDAPLGAHKITVDCTTCADAIADVELTFNVAGPAASYAISGPATIDANGSGMYTVEAMDTNGGIPNFTTDNPAAVDVFIQGLPAGNTRGLSTAGKLTLKEATGMGSFTIYAPSTLPAGTVVRIIAGSGDMEQVKAVTIGTAVVTPTDPAAPANVVASSFPGSGAIGVSWDAAPGNVAQYWVVVLDSSSNVAGFDVVGKNATAASVSNLRPGDYTVIVAAFYGGAVGFMYDLSGTAVTVN